MKKKKYIKYTLAELEGYLKDEGCCVKKIHTRQHLGLPIAGLSDLKTAIADELDFKIGRMDRRLNGIVLDIRNTKVFNVPTMIHGDTSDLHLDYEANFYVFQPQIGAIVQGIIKHIGPHYIGVLIYRVFSVAVKLGKTKRRKMEVNQKIKIRVVNFDLSSSLPEIEGELVAESNGDEHDIDSGIGTEDHKDTDILRVKKERKTTDEEGTTETDEPPTPKPILKNKKTAKKKDKTKPNKRVSFLETSTMSSPPPIKQEPESSSNEEPPSFTDFERSVDMFSTQLPLNVSVKEEPPSSSQEQGSSEEIKSKKHKKHKDKSTEEVKSRKRKISESFTEEAEDAFKLPPKKKHKKRDREDVQEVPEEHEVLSVPESEAEIVPRVKVKKEKHVTSPVQDENDSDVASTKKKKKKKNKSNNLDFSIDNVFNEIETAVAEIRVKKEKL